MKKLVYLFAAAILTSVLALSCQKTIDEPVQDNPSSGITRTFTCVFPESTDSKVSLGEDGKTCWEVDDEIMIHGGDDGGSFVTVKLTADDISADGKTATITFTGLDPYVHPSPPEYLSGYYAQYPAEDVKVRKRMYYECAFKGMTNSLLMAACNVGDSFTFYQLCGVISFKVNGTFDTVVLVGNDKEVVRYDNVYQVRVRDDGDGNGPQINYFKSGNESGDPIPMTEFEAPIVADGNTINYLYLPAGVNFKKGFTLKFYNGGTLVKTAGSTKAVNVAHGKYLKLGDISSKLKDYVAPTTSDHKSSITGATDISSDKANCYIITAAGAYKFPAHEGNSDDPAGNVFGVELVWETYNNDSAVTENSVISKVDFEDNWIYFETPSTLKPGNALIAAKDNDNKIIWSWHIWIPDTTIGSVTDATVFGNKPIMDRNLGALVAAPADALATVESYGMLYQWGRKDPFPGMDKVTHNGAAAVYGESTNSKDGTMTIAQSIQHPTWFANSADGKDWADAADQDNTLWTSTKTKYDPCPKGWIVPNRNTSVHFWDGNTLDSVASDNFVNNRATYYSFSIGTSTPVVFPFAGYIQMAYGDHYKAGLRTYIWSSYASSYGGNVDTAYTVFVGLDGSNEICKRTERGKCLGASVRCVAE